MSDRRFLLLAVDDVVALHAEHLRIYGGSAGLLSTDQLVAAAHAPVMVLLYEAQADVFDLAGAYAYHLCQAHAFVDGNKRTAFLATLAFLQLNGVPIPDDVEAPVCELVLAIAQGLGSRQEASAALRAIFGG